ncbi:siderophore-iron reductase FhuF [Guyparkeria sp. SB14A]|nr:siderophore-iron reductase FhuF [Guyparkeria sp. SB14A]
MQTFPSETLHDSMTSLWGRYGEINMQATAVQPLAGASPADPRAMAPWTLQRDYRLPEGIEPPSHRLGRNGVTAAALLEGAALDSLLDRFSARYPGGDRRAIASQWSKWLFHAWLSPLIATWLIQGDSLQRAPSDWGIRFSPDGQAERLWLATTRDVVAHPARGAFLESLTLGPLAEMIAVLARHSGASVNVFWSNAGNLVEHVVTRLVDHPAVPPDRLAAAQAFLDTARIDGQRNRLYRPVSYRLTDEASEPQRLRRACCIRYRLAEHDYCENCPLTCRSARGDLGNLDNRGEG